MNRPSAAALWIEAIICFGPLSFVLLLGVIFVPLWLAMLAATLTGAAQWVDDAGVSGWRIVWPVLFVVGGAIGLIGLIRMLIALSARNYPPRPSKPTAIMAFIGLTTLVAFNAYGGLPGNLISLLVYWVLPAIGAMHVLYLGRAVWWPHRGVPNDQLHRADT